MFSKKKIKKYLPIRIRRCEVFTNFIVNVIGNIKYNLKLYNSKIKK